MCRELEKTPARWKKLELHDILVESSRYALIAQESTREDVEPPVLDVDGAGGAILSEATPGLNHSESANPSLGTKLFFVTGFVIFVTAVARLVCPSVE